MRTRLLLPTLLLMPFLTFAQHDLATSPHQSAAVYAYRLKDAQALALFRSDLEGWEKIPLPPPVDSFPSNQQDDPRLSPGSYLFVQTIESHLLVTLRTIGTLHFEVLANGNTAALVLHTADGTPVTDAVVSVREHPVRRDTPFGAYLLGRWKKSRIVQV